MQANIWWKGKSCLHAPKAENVKGQGKIPQLKTETALNRESASCDAPAPLCVKSCPKSALGVPEALCAQPVLCSAHSLACTASPVTELWNLKGLEWTSKLILLHPPALGTDTFSRVSSSLAMNTCRDGAATACSVPQHSRAGCQHSHRAAWKKMVQILTVQKTKKCVWLFAAKPIALMAWLLFI